MALRENLNANFKQLQEENKVNNAYITGQVSTEKKMFEQVKSMKRSTFERSKFTVVGSPTISDDGIVSGFSSSNYIKKDITLQANNSIEYEFVVKLPNTTYATNRAIFNPISTSNNFLAFIYANLGYVTFNGFGGGNQEIKLGGTYKIRMATYSNGTFALNWTDMSTGVQGSKTGTNACYSTVNNTPLTITLGLTLNNVPQFPLVGDGSIDLKQFSVKVDGQEVFNGNKTGIDQIKSDNFIKVGSPIITDDGIASGFSGINRLFVPNTIDFNIANSWEVDGAFTFIKSSTTGQGILATDAITGTQIKVDINSSSLKWRLTSTKGISWDIINDQYLFDLSEGVKYYFKCGFTGNQYWFKYKTEELNEYQTVFTLNSTLKISNGTSRYIIGDRMPETTSVDFWRGSIDLNAFKIYVDGNLVYQPTLRIPYTQSKTGSKIVDAVYRDRVEGVYEQNGVAQYYTLGENDVTLPMGEIYGMFGNNFTNNPYSLLDCKWSDHEISNLSWLRSNGQWNNGNVYKSVYDLLVDIQAGRKTIAGVSVKLSTATYTDYDFVINTSNKTFRLATKTKLASGSGVVGNGMTLGLTNGVSNVGLWSNGSSENNRVFSVSAYDVPVSNSSAVASGFTNGYFGVTTDPTKSGIETDSTGLYLYYYVGESVTNHAIIDVADIASQLTKYDEWVYHQDGTSGYRYNRSNGYCEQWGQASRNASVTFIKKYSNANYNLILTYIRPSGSCEFNISSKSTTGFAHYSNVAEASICDWKASGYLAEGEF